MVKERSKTLRVRFECHVRLPENDRALLEGIKPQCLFFRKNTVVYREGAAASRFLLVESGLSFTYRYLQDGSRQIIDIFFPGEIIGLGDLFQSRHSSDLMALTDTVLAAYDRNEVLYLLSSSPVLSRHFMDMISREQALLMHRLLGLGRYCARQRVAHFLLEIRFRVGRSLGTRNGGETVGGQWPDTDGSRSNTLQSQNVVRIPQAVIADTLGLSIVHVNRTLRQLRREGLVGSRGHSITLVNISGLKAVAAWNGSEFPMDEVRCTA